MLAGAGNGTVGATAHCYHMSGFINEGGRLSDVSGPVVRHASAGALAGGLASAVLQWSDALEDGIELPLVLSSGAAALIGSLVVVEDDASDATVARAYTGYSYMAYSLDPNEASNPRYQFFKDGKRKFSNVTTQVLTCVVPRSWTDETGRGLRNGTALRLVVERTEFEVFAWDNTVYRVFFQFVVGLAFLVCALECSRGLYDYHRYSNPGEIHDYFLLPIICLVVNLGTSLLMSFIFFADGWGSRGFLTIETHSAFATLTQMTTTGTVLIMALHWMRLRMIMVGSASKRKESQRSFSDGSVQRFPDESFQDYALRSGKAKSMPRPRFMRGWCKSSINKALLNHLHMVVYFVAAICVFTDLISVLYVKIFREKIEDIWFPLLITIALLELGAAFFFLRETRLFRSGISFVLTENADLLSPAHLAFISSMLTYMSLCSAFLALSVVGSISCALPTFHNSVLAWNAISAVSVVARLGTAFSIIHGAFLNTNSRKQPPAAVHPVTSPAR